MPGVGDVQMWGQEYSIRIWLQPDKLAQLGLTPSDVADAVREQNSQFAGGRVGDEPMTDAGRLHLLGARRRAAWRRRRSSSRSSCAPAEAGAIVRLQDVARVELGAQTTTPRRSSTASRRCRSRSSCSRARTRCRRAARSQERLEELQADFPKGMTWTIPYDTQQYVKVSIKEVVKTLLEAMVLVFCVVLLFLQNWRATLIPMLAVPVSLIGTFAAMYLLGFSINMLTLFGMVLAIGIVVDDAIVVLENVERT